MQRLFEWIALNQGKAGSDQDVGGVETIQFPDVVAGQEMRLKSQSQVAGARNWASRRGWQFEFNEALSTGSGRNASSAGVSVGVSKELACAKQKQADVLTERFLDCKVFLGMPCWLHVISVYAHDGDGLVESPRDGPMRFCNSRLIPDRKTIKTARGCQGAIGPGEHWIFHTVFLSHSQTHQRIGRILDKHLIRH